MAEESGEKKIIIDEDWKSQVEAEKAAQEEKAKDAEQGTAEAAESAPGPGGMPAASFAMLLTTLASEAMVSLGQIPHPATGEQVILLDQARYFIDTLGILQEKTKGNLSDEEATMMESILHQLRMAFLEIQNSPPAKGGDS